MKNTAEPDKPTINVVQNFSQVFNLQKVNVPPGWYPLIENLLSRIIATFRSDDLARIEVRQIKEKFGTLRCYIRLNGATLVEQDALRALIDDVSSRSASTCQVCGAAGLLGEKRGLGVATLCSECRTQAAST